jgi:membrane-bound lytic murein transglycosylase MltF
MSTRLSRGLQRAAVLGWLALAIGCAGEPAAPAGGPAGQGTPADEGGAAPGAVADQAPAAETPADETPPAADANQVRRQKWTGDLDGMIERRAIRVLTTYSKINYFVDQATQRGLIYDAFRVFEDDLNAKLKTKHLRVHVVVVPVAHDDLIPALLDGRGDIVAAGSLLTEWRREQVDFSNPTRKGISSIIVTGPGVPLVPTPQDLAGREVYLRMSDVSKQGVERFNASLVASGKAPVKILPAPEVLADEDILEMVNAGLVPMTMIDDYVAEFWQQVFPNLVLNRGAAVRSGLETGMLVRKNSPQLLAELNAFLARYPEGSLRRNVLLQTYLKSLKYVRDASSQAEIAKFERTVALFRKYGDQYRLDALLMAAQGYQESRLDHSAKSPVGAIGIMQVMPATGKELNVGDITQVEPNINAGVKYMRFMIDRYYANEPMDTLNKGLFAFASYNAGPARVRGLRQRAEQRGLNPNVWFNNVEVIAAESIGRETVQYVANIYKYYLAYQMVRDQGERRRAALKGKSSS